MSGLLERGFAAIILQQIFDAAGQDLRKGTQGSTRRLVDVLGTPFVLLNGAEIHAGLPAQFQLSQVPL